MPRSKLLKNVQVIVPRAVHRAAPLAQALRKRGAKPVVMPLIDFERIDQCPHLDEALNLLKQGEFHWLVVTSVNTVDALFTYASEQGISVRELIHEKTKIAAIGDATAYALHETGCTAEFVSQGQQSTAGVLAQFPATEDVGGTVLIPQSDLADRALPNGLLDKGWQVAQVSVYRTVQYPAEKPLALHKLPEGYKKVTTAQRTELADLLAVARTSVVVLTAPSVARGFLELVEPGVPLYIVSIGQRTSAQISDLGFDVDATASTPSVDGIVEAIEQALLGQPLASVIFDDASISDEENDNLTGKPIDEFS